MTAAPPPPPPNAAASPVPAAETAKLLGALYRLALGAYRAESKQSLIFRILNDPALLSAYGRGALLEFGSGPVRLLGVSGQAQIDATTQLAEDWCALAGALEDPGAPALLCAEDFPDAAEIWARVAGPRGGLSVLWVPLKAQGRTVAGLWLERWEPEKWEEAGKGVFEALAEAYSAAWEKTALRRTLRQRWAAIPERRRNVWLGTVACLLYLLCLHPCRVHVVSPCEIVPEAPRLVAAPIDGVIEELAVGPGDRVEAGALLFRYRRDTAEQERTVSLQEVEAVRAELDEAVERSFADELATAKVAALRHRLAEQEAKLRVAEHKYSCLEVRSPSAGVVQTGDPETWRGRPVQTGERVLLLVEPARTKVRIWVAESDQAGIAKETTGEVYLNVRPGKAMPVRVVYRAPGTEMSPGQVSAFRVEAVWGEMPADALGLQGTAILYGERRPLLAWAFRKPWALFRRWTGL